MAVRVYVLEDHQLMRNTLIDFLERQPNLSVQGGAGSAEEALEQLDETPSDLVMVDTRLPGMSGIEFVEEVSDRWPEMQCVMLSAHEGRSYVEQAMEAGAWGYVVKGQPEEVLEAIEAALEEEVYFSASLDDDLSGSA